MTDIHRHRTKDGRPRDPLTERRTLYGKALTFPDEQMLITTIVLVTMIERGAYGRRSGGSTCSTCPSTSRECVHPRRANTLCG